jgi:iron complex transport system ATP-binding protein
MNTSPLLSAKGLDIAIAGKAVVRGLNLSLAAGETLTILGRNGAGKTTLLHTLAGLRPPSAGCLELAGLPYGARSPKQNARLRGLLVQGQVDAFPASVLETALVGRHPHLGRWDWEGAADAAIARENLAAVGLAGLEQRDVQTLSGGERQRLSIAALLTQRPSLYLLDEPTAHLDLNHQMALLDLVARYAGQCGAGFAIVLHDVNLALRYGGRALLLFGDGHWREGTMDEVLNSESLSQLYGHPLKEISDGARRLFVPV